MQLDFEETKVPLHRQGMQMATGNLAGQLGESSYPRTAIECMLKIKTIGNSFQPHTHTHNPKRKGIIDNPHLQMHIPLPSVS